jgi:hypothetical protein
MARKTEFNSHPHHSYYEQLLREQGPNAALAELYVHEYDIALTRTRQQMGNYSDYAEEAVGAAFEYLIKRMKAWRPSEKMPNFQAMLHTKRKYTATDAFNDVKNEIPFSNIGVKNSKNRSGEAMDKNIVEDLISKNGYTAAEENPERALLLDELMARIKELLPEELLEALYCKIHGQRGETYREYTRKYNCSDASARERANRAIRILRREAR